MKLRQIKSSATFAWSPLPSTGGMIACGSVAGALGDNFDAEATLEIYSLALNEKGETMPKLGSVRTHDRFNRVAWGLLNSQTEEPPLLQDTFPQGFIAGGLVDGTVQVWDAKAIVSPAEKSAEVCTIDKHKGKVKGVEFNPFNQPLLATGGQDGEWYVWNLTAPETPVVFPSGVKNPHNSEIVQLCWNRKVQHILAWTSSDGTTAVWDLKSKRQAMSFQDTQSRLRCSSLAWSPDKATDVCVASDDDMNPCIQFWDLRKAYSPVRVLLGHRQGVLSLSWSPMDSNLLVSCGKDCRSICWNPNSGEMLCELPVSTNWVFDVQWSPRIPAILSTASFGDNITVYSLQDSSPLDGERGGQEFLATGAPSRPRLFKTAPKWLRRPAGATFGFGGKLACFAAAPETEPNAPRPGNFKVMTVVTEPALVNRATKFEEMLKQGNVSQFCDEKINVNEEGGFNSRMWTVMKTLFEENPRKHMLDFLGYDAGQIKSDITKGVEESSSTNEPTEKVDVPSADGTLVTLIRRALVVGDFEAAVDCCLHTSRIDDALVLASHGGPELWKKTLKAYFERKAANPLMKVVSAVVENRLESVVNDFDPTAENDWKEAMAVLCTYSKPGEFTELAEKLAERLTGASNPAATLAYLAAGNFERVVAAWINDLKEIDSKKSQEGLMDFIEKVSVFSRITDKFAVSPELAEKYAQYAELLVSQGCLSSASRFLDLLKAYSETHHPTAVLRERAFRALASEGEAPAFPFPKFNVQPQVEAAPHAPVAQPPQQQQQQQPQFTAMAQQQQPVPQQAAGYGGWPQQQQQPQQQPQPQAPFAPQHQMQQQPQQRQPLQQQPQPPQWNQPMAPQQSPYGQAAPPQPPPQFGQPQQHQPPVPQHATPPVHQHIPVQPSPYAPQPPQGGYFPPGPPAQPPVQAPPAPSPMPAPTPTGPPVSIPTPANPPYSAPPAPPLAQPPPPSYPPTSMPPQPPQQPPAQASAPAATGGGSLAGVSTADVAPEWQPLVANLTNAYNRMESAGAEGRKKAQVEKALVALFGKLNAKDVNAEVCGLLLKFSQVCEVAGGHEGKEIIRKLTDQHWDTYKQFKDIKFMNK